MRKIAFLSPSFYPYRVPLFDELNNELCGKLVVVTNRHQLKPNSVVAQKLGSFPRVILRGRHFPISRHHDEGLETPSILTVTPGLAPCLLRMRPRAVISINFSLWTLTALVLGFPVVVFWEGTHHTERTVRPWRIRLRRWMVTRAKAFVVNGSASRNYVQECLHAPNETVFEGGMCPEPPPEGLAAVRRRHPSMDLPVRFIFVGQLIARKGPHHLLHALGRLERLLGPEARYEVVVLGDGPQASDLHTLARKLGIAHRVSFKGACPPSDVWQHYAEADVFVLPTQQDNWPLVVPEAMMMALPLLLSRHAGSVADLLREGENGYAFDPSQHDILASLMARYIRQPELIEAQGRKSMEIAAPYTPARTAQVYIAALDRALSNVDDK